jgi:hypothetical protein
MSLRVNPSSVFSHHGLRPLPTDWPGTQPSSMKFCIRTSGRVCALILCGISSVEAALAQSGDEGASGNLLPAMIMIYSLFVVPFIARAKKRSVLGWTISSLFLLGIPGFILLFLSAVKPTTTVKGDLRQVHVASKNVQKIEKAIAAEKKSKLTWAVLLGFFGFLTFGITFIILIPVVMSKNKKIKGLEADLESAERLMMTLYTSDAPPAPKATSTPRPLEPHLEPAPKFGTRTCVFQCKSCGANNSTSLRTKTEAAGRNRGETIDLDRVTSCEYCGTSHQPA